jgi:dTDP-4-dehydrorhamnose 3,5-epimerase
VDIRRSSPTFGRWCGMLLSSQNKRQFYLPPGFAHGFQVLSENALFYYKCTDYYFPQNEVTVRWDDPQIGIQWPLADPVLSARDVAGPYLKDISPEKLFE